MRFPAPSVDAQMAEDRISAALARLEVALRRHPGFGVSEESPAVARWQGGTKFTTRSPGGGQELVTDMPAQMGGDGGGVTPGWPLRAGLAACVGTLIVFKAAAEGIELDSLELTVGGRSDLRGLFAMPDDQGVTVSAAPTEVRLEVRIAARGVARDRLLALVEQANLCSPVSGALRHALPVKLSVEFQD